MQQPPSPEIYLFIGSNIITTVYEVISVVVPALFLIGIVGALVYEQTQKSS